MWRLKFGFVLYLNKFNSINFKESCLLCQLLFLEMIFLPLIKLNSLFWDFDIKTYKKRRPSDNEIVYYSREETNRSFFLVPKVLRLLSFLSNIFRHSWVCRCLSDSQSTQEVISDSSWRTRGILGGYGPTWIPKDIQNIINHFFWYKIL